MRVYMRFCFSLLTSCLTLSDGGAVWREAPPVAGVPAAAGAAGMACASAASHSPVGGFKPGAAATDRSRTQY